MNEIKTYEVSVVRANIINRVAELVTPDIKWCRINCEVLYFTFIYRYQINIFTTARVGGYIKWGDINIFDIVRCVFNQGTGARVLVRYNGRNIADFADIAREKSDANL